MTKIFLNREYRGIGLYLTDEVPGTGGQRERFALPIQFEERDAGSFVAEPHARLPFDEAQHLIDQLWQLGFRPSVGVSSAGQDEAQKAHIADLRVVVFRLLDIPEKTA